MSAGIACVAAVGGMDVGLYDIGGEAIAAGLQRVQRDFDGAVARNRMTAEDAATARKRITASTDLAGAAGGSDLVVEAVVEDMGVKQELFARIETLVARHQTHLGAVRDGDHVVVGTPVSGCTSSTRSVRSCRAGAGLTNPTAAAMEQNSRARARLARGRINAVINQAVRAECLGGGRRHGGSVNRWVRWDGRRPRRLAGHSADTPRAADGDLRACRAVGPQGRTVRLRRGP